MSGLQMVELFAGIGGSGQAIVEQIPVKTNEDDSYQLVKSPAFVNGVASGDVIKLQPGSREFTLVRRSGNVSIRVISRQDTAALGDNLTPALEKLGGELDIQNRRMLIYSIHVSCGFKNIEGILDQHVGDQSYSNWLYGNVYDPADGCTPLNWWLDILKPQ